MKYINVKGKALENLTIPFKFSPKYSLIMTFQKVFEGLVPTFQIIVTANFINIAIKIFNKQADIKEIIFPIILIILLISFQWISKKVVDFIKVKLEARLRENFRVMIVEKKAKLKYKYIENKETWDLISRVSETPELQITKSFDNILNSIALAIRVIGLISVLIYAVWWSAFIILLISIPLFYLAIKAGKSNYEAHRSVSEYQRQSNYIEKVITGRESASERAIFQYTNFLNEKWLNLYEKVRKFEFKVYAKWFTRMKLGGIIAAIISVLIVIVLLNLVKDNFLNIGLFISITNSVSDLVQVMSWDLTAYTQELAKSKEYLKDLSEFMNMEECKNAIDKPTTENITLETLEFKNVSFRYPNTDRYILKNLSFIIEKDKHYSFVGINGAGKTTITKLITGLYDEFEGEILINGINIKEYTQSQLKKLTSVVYQDFAKYFISIKDNIALGNLNYTDEKLKEKDIDNAIKLIELDNLVSKLDKGKESNLGKIKSDGIDVSGGQWQRIALARNILSDASLKILDEPTAALDPISESNLYDEFKEISKGKTTIFISHRLGSTKLADEIFVIENGKVIEKGSHRELMNINGKYANMYESQRSWYCD